MSRSENLIGKTFGRLKVVDFADDYVSPSGKHRRRWACQCLCGRKELVYVTTTDLKSGHTSSCGCYFREKSASTKLKDISGMEFGRLTVLNKTNYKGKNTKWLCQCRCGNTIEVSKPNLISGNTKSCGCLNKEIIKEKCSLHLTGQIFGKLKVVKQVESYNGSTYWLCDCECGNTTIVSGFHLNSGHTKSCGCSRSSGELDVISFMRNHDIVFEANKKFKGLVGVNGGQLSYDFFLPDKNILIECQGEQHLKPINHFGGEEQFVIQQEHDRRKKKYALKNGYHLIEIFYADYPNINEILSFNLSRVVI